MRNLAKGKSNIRVSLMQDNARKFFKINATFDLRFMIARFAIISI